MEEMPQKSMILYYNAYLDKAKIFYAQGEFELGFFISNQFAVFI
jgi:hypothetical protein